MTTTDTTDTYAPTRPVMSAAELKRHHIDRAGRDCALSGDGYDDMELASRSGWHAVSSWGRNGWDLGNWPYVVISVRTHTDRVHDAYEMRQTVEGDTDVYAFSTAADRDAAIDYLFQWYAAGTAWSVATHETRERLDAGDLEVPTAWRGPFSWERCS